jgi:hypothetical protein
MSPRVVRFPLSLLVLALILSLPAAASAASQGAPGGGFDPAAIEEMTASVHQVPLTADMVDRLIASFPDMRAAGEKFPGTQVSESAVPGSSDLDALPADKRAALEAVAAKHGFSGVEEWSDVASSVVMTYIFAMQGKKPGAINDAVKANIAQAERDPKMSAAQKAQTITQYRQIGEKLARLEPLKENYTLIVEMKDKVAPIMDPN